jgi:paraquat-inducible protein B
MDASQQLPEITQQLSQTLRSINQIVTQVEQAKLPERVVSTLDQTSATLRQVNRQLTELDPAGLSEQLHHSLGLANAAFQHLDAIFQKVAAEDGVLQSVQNSADSIAQIARGAQTVSPELRTTLKDVRGAARSIRRLADTLETDPDMLLKGRGGATP